MTNIIASLIEWVMAFFVDWLSADFQRHENESAKREAARAGEQAVLEASQATHRAAAEDAARRAQRLQEARESYVVPDGTADEANRLLGVPE